MDKQTVRLGAFLRPEAGFAAGSIDISDRWGGYLVLAGMMVWSLSRVVPDEYLWNIQAARTFTHLV